MRKFLLPLLLVLALSVPCSAAVDVQTTAGFSLCNAEHLLMSSGVTASCDGSTATITGAGSQTITGGTITGTTINNSVIGGSTPVAGTFTTLLGTVIANSTSQNVTPAAAIMIDGNVGNVFAVTPTANTIVSAQNLRPGFYALTIVHAGSTAYTITLNGNNIKTSGTPTFSTTATNGKLFSVFYYSDGTNLFEVNRMLGTSGTGF